MKSTIFWHYLLSAMLSLALSIVGVWYTADYLQRSTLDQCIKGELKIDGKTFICEVVK